MIEIPDMNEQVKARLQKLEELIKIEKIVYKERWDKEDIIANILKKEENEEVSCAGRIIAIREFGKLIFGHINDYSGKIQFAFDLQNIGEDRFEFFKKYVDIADFIGIKGKIFYTKTKEKTILVKDFVLLSKTLRPLPEKWHGITDTEIKYRQRYLDLIMNQDTCDRFVKRAKMIKLFREYLDNHGFIEVETPILQTKKSGALAKPFITHHNALDIDVYLRIAPETYLKRLVAGGLDRVYDLGKCFRNEGIDPSHLQEFTMLEFYAAYWNYKDLMKFTQDLIKYVVENLLGTLQFEYKGVKIDLSGDWPAYSFRELILNNCGIDINNFKSADELRKEIKNKGIQLEDVENLGLGNLIDALYKKVARPKMIQPQFLIHHPIDLSPLARRNDENPDVVDRFQLVINGWEVINAYSELVDPIDQRERFMKQAEAYSKGDEEALEMDEDFLLCMEHGMPPIAGWGMGIDRFLALLTSQDNLKDVILFPLMRPLKEEKVKVESYDLTKLNLSKEDALKIMKEYLKKEHMIKHSLASAKVMEGLAEYFGEDKDKWYILGLLHDIDYELTENEPEKHGILTKELLLKYNIPEDIIRIIQSHNEMTGVRRELKIDYALAAAETITGLIVATALVYPDKKLESVSVDSVLKRMKKKDFARNVSRETIMEIEKAGLNLEKFIEIALNSMKKISLELGL
ncbi:MAG: lysine--tRNA ligase [Spirochaetes bacterium]|nr:lysine--tRNA ligase [Spirochaetota bacterium]